MVCIASIKSDLSWVHGVGVLFATECEATMVFDQKEASCPLLAGREFLPQVVELKYIEVLFTTEGRMDPEINKEIGVTATIIHVLWQFVLVKTELSENAKLSIYQLNYIPRFWILEEAESFLHRLAR